MRTLDQIMEDEARHNPYEGTNPLYQQGYSDGDDNDGDSLDGDLLVDEDDDFEE